MVAVNKIDKEGADPNRVRGELAQQGLTPADWGGDTEFVDVSAKTRQNLEDLLETLVTLAEIQELKANPQAEASGFVIESRLDPRRGLLPPFWMEGGNPDHIERKVFDAASHGRRIEVTLLDNEVLVGTTLNYRTDSTGFFMIPADARGNNLRVFIVSSAVRQVRFP